VTRFADVDRWVIAEARKLAEVPADGNCAYTGLDDPESARAETLGRAKHLLRELAAIADRLGGEAEDAGRLAEVRGVLAGFDWERDDRQYALEAIERIAGGGGHG
jgi:hypothetical protein